MTDKLLLRALNGETLPIPPVWLMRQAGRYLPEYQQIREKAGSFLNLCYNPELAAEVTLQPIRRFGFDAAILFADILLIPQALGVEVSFTTGEGPILSKISNAADLAALRPANYIHQTLAPIYDTIRILNEALPSETTLIGFAGAPWTVASYMIAGRGTPDQAPAHAMLRRDPDTFFRLLDILSDATANYLCAQIDAGAEVVKLFDSWAGSVADADFEKVCIRPTQQIVTKIREKYPNVPIIGFPRGCGENYLRYAKATAVQGLALDTNVDQHWAVHSLRPLACLQGNLDPCLLETGGAQLFDKTQEICEAFSGGPHIFNLGHGITPMASPANVDLLLKAVRG